MFLQMRWFKKRMVAIAGGAVAIVIVGRAVQFISAGAAVVGRITVGVADVGAGTVVGRAGAGVRTVAGAVAVGNANYTN
ncbi:MAG: hypothetical protein AAF346_23380 [Pseudomonadota bacterium]